MLKILRKNKVNIIQCKITDNGNKLEGKLYNSGFIIILGNKLNKGELQNSKIWHGKCIA